MSQQYESLLKKSNFKGVSRLVETNRSRYVEGRYDPDAGEILETLPNATFRVKLENGHVVLGAYFRQDADALYPYSCLG